MAVDELQSFVNKFKYLCSAGYSSLLTFKAENGTTKISFDVSLGFLPPPISLPPPVVSQILPNKNKKRNASYVRRLDRRRSYFTGKSDILSSNKAVDECVMTEEVKLCSNKNETTVANADLNQSLLDKNIDVDIDSLNVVNDLGVTEVDISPERVAADTSLNESTFCDFSSKWENGLAIHVSLMHGKNCHPKKLRSKYDEEMNLMTQNYWKTRKLENNRQVYINALLDV